MRYQARALTADQSVQTLVLEALDEQDAREQLQGRGLAPLSLRQRASALQRGAEFPLLLFVQELQALLEAGLSVIEALEALGEKETRAVRRGVIARLVLQLRQGQRLSAALRQQPRVFPPLFAGLVQAAEDTSDLPRALGRWLAYQQGAQRLRQQVASAAIYPGVLLLVGLAVSAFLLGHVVPRFASVYQGSGRALPWASAWLLRWGQLVDRHALALGLVAALLLLAAAAWWRRRGLAGILAALSWLPGLRERLETVQLARLYLTLGMLVEGGIPVHPALGLAAAAVPVGARDRLVHARLAVGAGQPLSDAFQAAGLATPVALRLLRVGERSGQLGAMLGRAAAFHEDENARWIERFSKAFEPLLMAAIGLVVGVIVVLLYLPIFELAGSLG